MKTLKSLIRRYMYLFTCSLVAIVLVILIFIQILTEQRRAYNDAIRTISQIESVLEENKLEKNKKELSYIFSLFRVNPLAGYYAVDSKNGEIVGATEPDIVGANITELNIDMYKIQNDEDGFHSKINNRWAFCVFKRMNENYIGRVVYASNLYRRVPMTAFWIFIGLLIVALILVQVVVKYMNRYVVMQIDEVNKKLQSIANGNLEERLDIRTSFEFVQLSNYINLMVKSLISNNKKMSYILTKTNIHVGTYEYDTGTDSVQYTEFVPEILSVSDEKMKELTKNHDTFVSFLNDIKSHPVSEEPSIYQHGDRFIRIEEIVDKDEMFGVVVDVTQQITKQMEIEKERDLDVLTGLYNRRGFEHQLEQLFFAPQKLGYYAIIMIDADGLKEINDTYGHEKGDIYLKKIGSIIRNFGIRESVAARQGGDEYVLVLYDYESENELFKTIKTLEYIQNNSTAHLGDGLDVPLRFSMGYCLAKGEVDYNQLLKEADDKMYKDKVQRKSHVKAFEGNR